MGAPPHILEVPTNAVEPALDELRRAALDVGPGDAAGWAAVGYTVRRGRHAVTVGVDPDPKQPGVCFVLVPHPPYSWWPGRWRGDAALFDAVAAAFAGRSTPSAPGTLPR